MINVIETLIDNEEILSLNEKHIEKELDYKNLRENTNKYHSDDIKHR